MRRFLLALAVFFTASVTPTFAGYIILRVLLEGSAGPGGGGMSPPGPGGPGASGGSKGGPPRGGPAASGGSGGLMPPGPGGPGGPGPAAGAGGHAADFDHTRSVVVVVPLETDLLKEPLNPKFAANGQTNPVYRKFSFQHYGQKLRAGLYVDSSTIQLYDELIATPAPRKTRRTEVLDRHQAWAQGKTDLRVLYDALNLALQAGMVTEAMAYADELVAAAGDKKLTVPEGVKPFVAAWGAVGKAVQTAPAAPSDAEAWRDRLDFRAGAVHGREHYAIVAADSGAEEVARRATQLNDNFKAFYLWHATRGAVLPVPDRPLVAVLAPDTRKVRELNLALDGLATADAFFAPDHNLLVLSPERMDDVGQTFLRQNQQLFSKGLNRTTILSNVLPKIDPTGEKGARPEDVVHAQTVAAVERLAVDEAEIAAVSREGTRQLLYATGALPRHVTLPTWLTNGAVNFFARPRGPAYVTVGDDDKPYMHVALATGYGGPNYVLLRYYRDLAAKKELPPVDPARFDAYAVDSVRLLENVLGDVYFTGIKGADDPDPAPPKKVVKKPAAPSPMQPGGPGPMGGGPGPLGGAIGGGRPGPGGDAMEGGGRPGGPLGGGPLGGAFAAAQEDVAAALRKKQQRLAIKANATSWALYYYLAKDRPADLARYVAEMNKQPRDLPIDGKTALAVFVRVFALAGAEDGVADPAKMKAFAEQWLTYVNTVPLAGVDVPLVTPEPSKAAAPGGMPGMPGGRPGGGAGGAGPG